MLRIRLPTDGAEVSSALGRRVPTAECGLSAVAERIWTCTEHQQALTGIVSDILKAALPPQPVEAKMGTSREPVAIAVLSGSGISDTPAPDQPMVDDWVPFDEDPHNVGAPGSSIGQIDSIAPSLATFPADPPTSPFDDLFTAVSRAHRGRTEIVGSMPPPRRFMVRVAPVKKPHRPTKRNYDYFEELNESLKRLAQSESSDIRS